MDDLKNVNPSSAVETNKDIKTKRSRKSSNKSKYRITNATFNQIIKNVSDAIAVFFKDLFGVIKSAILLALSFYLATNTASKIITLYFNNVKSTNTITGSNNVINSFTGITPVPDTFYGDANLAAEKAKVSIEKETSLSSEKIAEKPSSKEVEKVITKEIIIAKIPNLYLSQEYPSFPGYDNAQSIILSSGSVAVIKMAENEQKLYFGIGNIDTVNINNPTLFLQFDGDFDIMAKPNESLGWLPLYPNKQFAIKINVNLQPGNGLRLPALFVRFPKPGRYHGKYSITTDDNLPKTGDFVINVVE